MSEPSRDPKLIMREAAGLLALLATRVLYEEQPALWELGEHGRARTLEDFGHHFRSLALLDGRAFGAHVDYCTKLFTDRGFPLRWLDDAWRVMAAVSTAELPPAVAAEASKILSNHQVRGVRARG